MNPFKVLGIFTKVGVKSTIGIVKGTFYTASDCCRIAERVLDKDPDGALNILEKRANRTISAVSKVAENAGDLIDTVADDNGKIWTEKNVEKMAHVATFGLITAVGIDTLIDSDEVPTLTDADFNIDIPSDHLLATSFGLDTDAISNGTFVGDENDLNDLILAGENSSSHHLNSDEYTRDIGLRDTFLAAHGWDHVPEGYEVHHIVPLSEGGPDSLDNMILISESEHSQITAAHRNYYNW